MFTILPLSRKVQNQIRKLRPSDRKKLAEAFKAIEANPYWAPGGKISRFVGDLAELGWHYELSHSTRIHYQINERDRTVKITYVGPHPDY